MNKTLSVLKQNTDMLWYQYFLLDSNLTNKTHLVLMVHVLFFLEPCVTLSFRRVILTVFHNEALLQKC